jgi:pyridoxine 5-phosphate synthase
VLTSNAGWDAITHREFLKEIIATLKKSTGRVSLFVEASPKMVEAVAETGADRIELYTEPYAKGYPTNKELAIKDFIKAAEVAKAAGLGVNAGHDLDLNNLRYLKTSIPWLDEVSIGHALISDALYFGLENTIQLYLRKLK